MCRRGGDAKSRIKHDRGYRRMHELFALPRLVLFTDERCLRC
jgi:hypothetical protein